MTQRIERLERENRRGKMVMGVVLAGAAALVMGGIDRPAILEAQEFGRQDEPRQVAEARAEAQVKLALKALKSINQRLSSGAGIMNRDYLVALWSRRLLIAQLEATGEPAHCAAFFEAHQTRMKDLEERGIVSYRDHRISDLEQMETEYHRRRAEAWSARVKAGRTPWRFFLVLH
jgi:hypothetical protein